MTKEKLVSLTKYVQDLTNKLNSLVPPKHKDHPAEYKAFLKHEIHMAQKKLDDAKLEGAK